MFLYQCGGRYDPESIPEQKTIDTVSKERKIVKDKEENLKVEMVKVSEKTNNDVGDDIYQKGIASWYGGKFQGRRTANGEVYDKYKLTSAHKTLPFNSIVEVTNLNNFKKVIVRINDRGPFVKGRIIDLSKKAANMIGMEDTGTAPVTLKILNKKELNELNKAVVFSKPSTGQLDKSVQNYSVSTQWFYIQAGAFQDRVNATRVVDKIKRVTDVKFIIKKNNGFYKVVSVKLSPKSFADKISSDLKEYYIDTFVKSF